MTKVSGDREQRFKVRRSVWGSLLAQSGLVTLLVAIGVCLAIRGNCPAADSTAGTAAELSAASHSGERPMRALQPQELLSAMYKTLDTREAKIEIVDQDHRRARTQSQEY